MLGYLLDTDTVSFALRIRGLITDRLVRLSPSQIHLSSLTLAELRYGAEKKGSKKLDGIIDSFIKTVTVLPFDASAATRYGVIAAILAKRGEPIGVIDTLIAAHAIATGLTLVTNNTKHFARVPGLRLENWR
ncbi:MAG: PIN domain-containing protein [Candidatus Hydrogenedentes bacterium]|nr:PIN domain-containing protein [Candidatus Hydrogenedentota bacterium]